MKQIIIAFLIFILLSGIGNAEDNYNVTWTPVSESIINKEYIITVQNLQTVNKNINIKSFFDETNFNINKLKDIEFYEWKLIPYTYTIDHYDEISYLEFDSINGTWYNVEESVFNYTETVESEKLDWKACKSQLFTSTVHTIKDDYGLINIPKLGSKDTGVGTYNGTKRFLLKFKTPITDMESGYGSSGKVAILLDNVEYHPYWNTSWSNRTIITLTGNTSGAQTDYQILLNITYESGMQSDFDDLRFTNDTHELDAWLESKVNDSYALVWVEFPTTPINGITQNYYMYYGNVGAASDWDGDAVFEFFDDFEGDLSKWTLSQQSGGTASIVSGECQITDGAGTDWSTSIRLTATLPAPTIGYFLQGKMKSNPVGVGMVNFGFGFIESAASLNFRIDHIPQYIIHRNAAYTPITSPAPQENVYDTMQLWYDGTDYNWNIVERAISGNEAHNVKPVDIVIGSAEAGTPPVGYFDNIYVRKYATNPPTYEFGSEEHQTDSIHYNAGISYNHTIESDGTITANRSITATDDINWTAAAVLDNCQLLVTEYNLTNTTIANFTLYTASLDWLQVTNLTIGETYNLANSTTYEQQTADASGEANFTTDLIPGDYQILVDTSPPVSITGLTNITGNFYHNWTWTNPTDIDFNYTTIYINGSWITNTSNEYYNLSADAHNQSTISTHTVDIMGKVNSTWVNHTSTIPNNPITITNTSDWSGNIGETVYIDYDTVDADLDTPVYSCNRLDLFTDFDTVTGKGNWTVTDSGTWYVDFGVSDGWGSISNYTMIIYIPISNVQSFIDETILMFTILKTELIGVKNNMGDYLLYAFIFGGIVLIFVIIKLLISIVTKEYKI